MLADKHGNAVALGERECSVQRRHQKLLEESPSPVLSQATRERMMAAGVAAAKASGYYNAGTVEFLFDPATDEFFFLEVNTRLQVEHPVTELLCGRDLVRDQIRIAAGEPLGFTQDDVVLRGAAIECRIAAEDPYNNYLPSLGRIDYVNEPSGPGVRVDSSIFSGIEIPYFYDPMLAKLICWGADRTQAIERMKRALGEYVIAGVKTNIPFHLQLLDDPRFVAGQVHTGLPRQRLQDGGADRVHGRRAGGAAGGGGDVAQPALPQRRTARGDHGAGQRLAGLGPRAATGVAIRRAHDRGIDGGEIPAEAG